MHDVDGGHVDEDMRWRHIDECLTDFAADTFAGIPRTDRMPLTMAVFDEFTAAAARLLLNVSLLLRVGKDTTKDLGPAASNKELVHNFSQTPRWLTMPPEVIIHGPLYRFLSPGAELPNAQELWGRPSGSTIKCFYQTLHEVEDPVSTCDDYLFVFA
jgi:hypothetical protein